MQSNFYQINKGGFGKIYKFPYIIQHLLYRHINIENLIIQLQIKLILVLLDHGYEKSTLQYLLIFIQSKDL